MFVLNKSGEDGIALLDVDDSGAKVISSFGKLLTTNGTAAQRAGKIYNPKAITYYTKQDGNNYYGGLIILEEGINTKSRIQIIRSNMADWIK